MTHPLDRRHTSGARLQARIDSGWTAAGPVRRLLGCGGSLVVALAWLGAFGPIASSRPAWAGDDRKPSDIPRARVAAAAHESMSAGTRTTPPTTTPPGTATLDAVNRAKQMVAEARLKYESVHDYTATFYKRERLDGVLSSTHVMQFKARTSPLSIYVKCVNPRPGREAIWIKGQNSGKVIAHDAGFFKVLAGTMYLDPKGGVAMEDNRHPITEAGLGHLIDTILFHWDRELTPGKTRVDFHPGMKVGDRECTMIETTHPAVEKTFMFSRVRLYIDDQLGLPIRIEGYDWPKHVGAEPELVEEYTFANLRINTGLTERDFDPGNPLYSYSRF